MLLTSFNLDYLFKGISKYSHIRASICEFPGVEGTQFSPNILLRETGFPPDLGKCGFNCLELEPRDIGWQGALSVGRWLSFIPACIRMSLV